MPNPEDAVERMDDKLVKHLAREKAAAHEAYNRELQRVKSTLLAAEQRAEENDAAARTLNERVEEEEQRAAKAESERDALAGALGELQSELRAGEPWDGIVAKAVIARIDRILALAANPQASNEKKGT